MFKVPKQVLNYTSNNELRNKGGSYASLSNETFPEAIEIMEELLDADLSLKDLCLHSLLNVQFVVECASWLGDAKTSKIRGFALSHPCDRNNVRTRERERALNLLKLTVLKGDSFCTVIISIRFVTSS